MDKIYSNSKEALEGVAFDGMVLMCGGFGLCGIPERMIDALKESKIKNITAISNNAGIDGEGLGLLLETKQISKMISSYVGENKIFAEQYLNGEIELEFNPQGTLAERIRAGGAGIPAFFTPTSVNTPLAVGKESRIINGVENVLEYAIKADYSLVKCHKSDRYGNLIYHATARNFGPIMCSAANIAIVQSKQIVEVGELNPEEIITPGIFVKRVIEITNPAHESELVANQIKYPC